MRPAGFQAEFQEGQPVIPRQDLPAGHGLFAAPRRAGHPLPIYRVASDGRLDPSALVLRRAENESPVESFDAVEPELFRQ